MSNEKKTQQQTNNNNNNKTNANMNYINISDSYQHKFLVGKNFSNKNIPTDQPTIHCILSNVKAGHEKKKIVTEFNFFTPKTKTKRMQTNTPELLL